ncbi:MAG: MoaD/ThiS family protein [Planctomycetes bacterium]|nr:MoaD/ThiS family protein [Planctomycetota bacterium]
MKIKITAYGILRSYLGQGSVTTLEKEISRPKPIKEIAGEMGIPDGMIMMVAVNDQQKDFDYVPQDGDDIKLIPPISGG